MSIIGIYVLLGNVALDLQSGDNVQHCRMQLFWCMAFSVLCRLRRLSWSSQRSSFGQGSASTSYCHSLYATCKYLTDHIFDFSTKKSDKAKRPGKAGNRFWKNIGLGFKTPQGSDWRYTYYIVYQATTINPCTIAIFHVWVVFTVLLSYCRQFIYTYKMVETRCLLVTSQISFW